MRHSSYVRSILTTAVLVLVWLGCTHAETRTNIPAPTVDAPLAHETAIFAGGCFWGTQSVFERVKGVVATTVGYSGGSAKTAT